MTVSIPNYAYRYEGKGKPVFVPSGIGRRIGNELKATVEAAYQFEPTYFHLRAGGHVAAMHHHRGSQCFARIDIANFFYSLSRRRVKSALDRVGTGKADFFSKWSTVANPFNGPAFVLPYGFVQSPILASLVLATSDVGEHLRNLPASIRASVYMDDISLSSDFERDLQDAYEGTLDVLAGDGLAVSAAKLRPPAAQIDLFNCDVSYGWTAVREERIEAFLSGNPSPASEEAFVAYCASVEVGNL
jgi:hypothetical protein